MRGNGIYVYDTVVVLGEDDRVIGPVLSKEVALEYFEIDIARGYSWVPSMSGLKNLFRDGVEGGWDANGEGHHA